MIVLKTLAAFFIFWGVIVLGIFIDFGKWLSRVVFRSRKNFAIVAIIVIAVIIVLGVRAISASPSQQLPPQPLAFQHNVHAGKLGIPCVFCHRTAQTQPAASIPSLEQCMFCHQVAARDNPEVAKLLAAYGSGTPLNWLRINRVPDTVHFDHSAHTRPGIDIQCATCHGPVETMAKIKPIRSLKMGDCLSCHRARGAPTSCSTCHY